MNELIIAHAIQSRAHICSLSASYNVQSDNIVVAKEVNSFKPSKERSRTHTDYYYNAARLPARPINSPPPTPSTEHRASSSSITLHLNLYSSNPLLHQFCLIPLPSSSSLNLQLLCTPQLLPPCPSHHWYRILQTATQNVQNGMRCARKFLERAPTPALQRPV